MLKKVEKGGKYEDTKKWLPPALKLRRINRHPGCLRSALFQRSENKGGARTPDGVEPPPAVDFGYFFTKKMQIVFTICRACGLSPFFIKNENGSGTWARTRNQVVNSHLLYH